MRHTGTTDKDALAGLSDAQITAAGLAAKERKLTAMSFLCRTPRNSPTWIALTQRSTRQALFENSWNRAERGGANDTRDTVARLAQLRAQKAKLLGFPNYAAWKLEDQMAKTPDAALKFMDALVPGATAEGDRAKPRIFRPDRLAERTASSWSHGTGTTTPSRFAKRSTTWMKPRSSLISS